MEGLLKESGALLIHEDTLWHVIDDWVTGLPLESFILLLPLLRRTFSTFSSPEKRMIGERARQGAGPTNRQEAGMQNFDQQCAEAVLPLLEILLGIVPGESEQS